MFSQGKAMEKVCLTGLLGASLVMFAAALRHETDIDGSDVIEAKDEMTEMSHKIGLFKRVADDQCAQGPLVCDSCQIDKLIFGDRVGSTKDKDALVSSIRTIEWDQALGSMDKSLAHTEATISELEATIKKLEGDMGKLTPAEKAPIDAKGIQTMITNAIFKFSQQELGLFGITAAPADAAAALNIVQEGVVEDGESNGACMAFDYEVFDGAAKGAMEDFAKHKFDRALFKTACTGLLKDKEGEDCADLCAAFASEAQSAAGPGVMDAGKKTDALQQKISEAKNEIFEARGREGKCKGEYDRYIAHAENAKSASSAITGAKEAYFRAQGSLKAAEASAAEVEVELKMSNEEADKAHQVLEKHTQKHASATAVFDDMVKKETNLIALIKTGEADMKKAQDDVSSSTRAVRTVGEFRLVLENMLLAWTQYYQNSVVKPLQDAARSSRDEALTFDKANAEFIGGVTDATAKVGKYCEEEQEALKNVKQMNLLEICVPFMGEKSATLGQAVVTKVKSDADTVMDSLKTLETSFSYTDAYEGNAAFEVLNSFPEAAQGHNWKNMLKHPLWPSTSKYFGGLSIYKDYLRGWKELKPEEEAKFEAATKHKVDAIEGKWAKMVLAMGEVLEAAEAAVVKAEKDLSDLQKALTAATAAVEKATAALKEAEAAKTLSAAEKKAAEAALKKVQEQNAAAKKNVAAALTQLEVSNAAVHAAKCSYFDMHKGMHVKGEEKTHAECPAAADEEAAPPKNVMG